MNNQNETGNQNYQNNQQTQTNPSVPTGAEPKKKSKKPLVITIVALIVAVGLAVGGYCVYNAIQKSEEEKTEVKSETSTEVKKETEQVSETENQLEDEEQDEDEEKPEKEDKNTEKSEKENNQDEDVKKPVKEDKQYEEDEEEEDPTPPPYEKAVPDSNYLMELCPPYQTKDYNSYHRCTVFSSSQTNSFLMGGKKYTNGLTLAGCYSNETYALFNLEGQYQSIEMVIAPVDGNEDPSGIAFIVDGKTMAEYIIKEGDYPKTISVPLNYGLQLKIVTMADEGEDETGLGNIIVK